MTPLSDHRNALDVLRLAAAWVVLFGHQFALLGLEEPLLLGHYGWGELGVGVFFFLSGGLVWSSWCRDPHWGRFFARRSLRIFPALVVVVLLTVCALGPWLSRLDWHGYWAADGTWRYFKTLLLNNQKGLPGVFEHTPLADAVNGSLWSLGPEFLAYGMVALVGGVVHLRRDLGAALLLLCMVALLTHYAWSHDGHTKPHLEVVAMFGWGAWWAQWRTQRSRAEPVSRLAWACVLLALVVYAVLLDDGMRRLGLLFGVAVLVWWAHRVTWGQAFMARFGDVSYGVYIYAFPVQQTLIYFFPQWHLGLHLGVASALTLALAWLSWHGVEQMALRFKPVRPA